MSAAAVLSDALRPCGPVLDASAAARLHDRLAPVADEGAWRDRLEAAWPALQPVFSASPYLAGLVRRSPARLERLLSRTPDLALSEILEATDALTGPPDEVRAPLRALKGDLHLLTALCDLGGVWDLDRVTGALSDFADATVRAALASVASAARGRGWLTGTPDEPAGPVPGLFGLAMGKHGARELNYSSDIDLTLFFDPDRLATALGEGIEAQRTADRLAQGVAQLLTERTADGYVFRVDLRLRPDPASTPPVVATPRALHYYESVGQNWERAAFIKARAVCGDMDAATAFLDDLEPFIWRRSLDYPAILDIQAIKKQIHAVKTGEGLEAAGADLKLGRGGIREIEFFVQTQQLILGGRDRSLRSRRTLDALSALTEAGHVTGETRDDLTDAYLRLRDLEHRVQMLEDEQTHTLPADPDRRRAVAALAGQSDLSAFDASIEAVLLRVNARYAELFEGGEDLSSEAGSLVFTGVDNDPATLETLRRMGFQEPVAVADAIRGWHHGRIAATRSARGRELFTRLAPRLLEAFARTGAPDAAFRRFGVFFSSLTTGVQYQALLLNQPALFDRIVGVMAVAPRLARMLGRQPAALDSMLDDRFNTPLGPNTGLFAQMADDALAADDLEEAMNAVRRLHREQMFRIGMQTLTGVVGPEAAGLAATNLADACVRVLADAVLRDITRTGGDFPGRIAVLALGKAGSREMTAASDLDLMTVYEAPDGAVSSLKAWSADVWATRFTQRLIAALSAQTAKGGLYEVDMRLRPSGSKGPVSVRLSAFRDYYAGEAATWEFMALTRARSMWASDPAFAEDVQAAVGGALALSRPGVDVAADVRAMRDLMRRERPGSGFWDLKLAPGGLVDAEFVGQYRRLTAAANGEPGPVVSSLEQLAGDPALAEAWRLQQGLNQILACAFDDAVDPANEPEALQRRLADAVGAADYHGLVERLTAVRQQARAAFEAALPPPATESGAPGV